MLIFSLDLLILIFNAKKDTKEKTKKNNSQQGVSLGFEAKLFLAADKLRGSMDASEYKHVALGLVLKYISDAFHLFMKN